MNTLLIIGIILGVSFLASVGVGKHFALSEERESHAATIGQLHAAQRANADMSERITLGKAQNERLVVAADEARARAREIETMWKDRYAGVRADCSRLETQLMHALATMDSANKKYAEVEDRYAATINAFKHTSDQLFINAEELRAQNAGLLETVRNATEQLVTIAQEFAGLRRVGFVRGAEVAVNTTAAQEPARFGSTSEADEAAAKQRGMHVIDAGE